MSKKGIIIGLAGLLGGTSLCYAGNTEDPVLLTIDGQPVYQSEFEYIYYKNNTTDAIDPKSIDEYMEMFINFKLKVVEAEAQGLDTTSAFVKELSGYRRQLTRPYLTDEAAIDSLVREAYQRKLTDVEMTHIALQVPHNATEADTLAVYEKALLAKQRVTTGIPVEKGRKTVQEPEAFDAVAREMSDDPSAAQNGGYYGWVAPFRIVYPLENVVYTTPIGEVSDPVRSPFGYHIVKTLAKRPSPGEISVSHIVIMASKNDEIQSMTAKQKIDSIYQCVMNGEDFAELAKKCSEDRGTASRGGALPWFGTGQMIPEFADAAFALKEKGDISEPVRSAFGWHIIKLNDKRAIAPFDEQKDDLRRSVERDGRIQVAQQSFINKLKKAYGFRVEEENLADFYELAKQHAPGDPVFKQEAGKLSKPLFSFADKNYSQADFAAYLSQYPVSNQTIPGSIIQEKFDAFVARELTQYEDSQLENKYTDFRNLIREYHDGILLFEISNHEVWERASTDTEGITNFFEQNRKNYAWDKPRYKGYIVYCKDNDTYKAARAMAKKATGNSMESYLTRRLNDSIQYVRVETGLYVQGDHPAIDKYVFKTGSFEPSEEYPYVFVGGKLLKTLPESYQDVRGSVTADYQDFLEQNWITELRKKHHVVINEETFELLKQKEP